MICIFHACSELCSCRISKNKSNGNIKTLIWSRNRTCYLTLPWILYYEILVVWCFDSVEDKVCLDLHSILSYYFVYLLLYLLLSLIHLIHCWSWANWLKEPFFFLGGWHFWIWAIFSNFHLWYQFYSSYKPQASYASLCSLCWLTVSIWFSAGYKFDDKKPDSPTLKIQFAKFPFHPPGYDDRRRGSVH